MEAITAEIKARQAIMLSALSHGEWMHGMYDGYGDVLGYMAAYTSVDDLLDGVQHYTYYKLEPRIKRELRAHGYTYKCARMSVFLQVEKIIRGVTMA